MLLKEVPMKKSLIISLALILASCGSNLQEPEQKNNNTIDAISDVKDDSVTEEVKIGHWNGEDCDSEWYGTDCNSKCDCLHGECNSGVLGDGFCNCDENWAGDRCDTITDNLLCIWYDEALLSNDYERECAKRVNINKQFWTKQPASVYSKANRAGYEQDVWSKDELDFDREQHKNYAYTYWDVPTYEDWQELLNFVRKKYKEYGAENVFEALIARRGFWNNGEYRHTTTQNEKVVDVFGFSVVSLAPQNDGVRSNKAYFWGYNEDEEQPYSLFVIDGNMKEIYITRDIDHIESVWSTEKIQIRKINRINHSLTINPYNGKIFN